MMSPWQARQLADERGVCPLCRAKEVMQTDEAGELVGVMRHEDRCPVPDARKPQSDYLWTP